MNALQSILQMIGGAAQKGVQNIPSAVSRAKDAYQNFQTDLPANTAYAQDRVHQAIAPKMLLPTPDQIIQEEMQGPKIPMNPNLYNNRIEKSMSAEMQPYLTPPNTPQATFEEQEKQKVLKSGIFRPAMQRYLSTIPVYTYEPNQQQAGIAMTQPSRNLNNKWEDKAGGSQSIIGMALSSKTNFEKMKNNPISQGVMAHELIHTAPRNSKFKNEFKSFFKKVTPESSPILYNTGLQYFQNGQPPPNEEEMYATLGQQLGPRALLIPEIRDFYINLFANKQGQVPFSPLSGGGEYASTKE